jgi:hypothetical protein
MVFINMIRVIKDGKNETLQIPIVFLKKILIIRENIKLSI